MLLLVYKECKWRNSCLTQFIRTPHHNVRRIGRNTWSAPMYPGMGEAQVQSLTLTPLEHFGPLKGGGGLGRDQKPPLSSSRQGRGGLRG